MESIEKLTELFRKFPGIGPRQARRFVYFLLLQDPRLTKELGTELANLRARVKQCAACFRFFNHTQKSTALCDACKNPNIDTRTLVIVEKDIDLDTLRKASNLNSRFFVLGGLVPVLDKEAEKRVRLKELEKKLTEYLKDGLAEIICAFSVSPHADHTVEMLKERISPIIAGKDVRISVLGRGLSTGTELEYSDAETIKQALANRK